VPADPHSLAYDAEICPALEPFLARCEALLDGRSLPFHATWWLRAWYASFGSKPGLTPLLVAVRHRDSGVDAALLPLVSCKRHGLRVVEFVDGGVVDYVAPLLAPDWHGGQPPQAAANTLWQTLRQALRRHDVFYVHKLLPQLMDEAGLQHNPLALAWRTAPCEMFGNQFKVGQDTADWDTWRRTLDKRTRKEIERCWRVFQRSPEARFEHVTEPAAALALFQTLEQQQSQRMRALGTPYRLDAPECRDFYRQVIQAGLEPGATAPLQVVLTALFDGDHVVSAMLGVANGHRFIGLRQSLGGDAWKLCSPARLLDEQTARHLHGQGREHFDFGIGDYHHKQALQMRSIALADACEALSWRGWPMVWAWRMRVWLKGQAWLVSAVRRWRLRPTSA
jgi:CelD/BcsL family acetyltransferase involved in cellulose biosynthesis